MEPAIISADDARLLVALVSKLNPNDYPNGHTQAVIYKAKSIVADNFRMVVDISETTPYRRRGW